MGSPAKNNLAYVTSFKDRHGRRRFYFRYRHQKYKLPGKPGDAAFHEAYARYLNAIQDGSLGRNNVTFINGTIGWVIEKYLVHDHGLLKHSENTQKNYRFFCDIIKREIGQFKIADLTPAGVRAMRDSISMKHKPSVADLCVTIVSALWQFAIEHQYRLATIRPGAFSNCTRRSGSLGAGHRRSSASLMPPQRRV
jgi:hypothetical protein